MLNRLSKLIKDLLKRYYKQERELKLKLFQRVKSRLLITNSIYCINRLKELLLIKMLI